jgi:hypothetical protein
MTATMTPTGPRQATSTRYSSTERHNISRCERGLSPILEARCRCAGKLFGAKRGDGEAFFEQLSADDPHSFQTLPDRAAQLIGPRGR